MEAVRVTAADYAHGEFDGSPFDGLPEWLIDAVNDKRITIHRSDTDYAVWRVDVSDEAYSLAFPDQYIVYNHDAGSMQVVDRDRLVSLVAGR